MQAGEGGGAGDIPDEEHFRTRYYQQTMKLICLLSLCLVTQFVMPARVAAAEDVSAYQQAVNAYVEAAGSELHALRIQAEVVMKAAPLEKQALYKGFFIKLEKCEAIQKELKASAAKDFDKTKARYEQARLETVKEWAAVSSK